MRKIGNFVKSFLRVDFPENTVSNYSQDELTRIQLVNYLCVITIFNMLTYVGIYSILDFNVFKPAIYFLFGSSFLTLLVIVVNKRGFYNTAKILLAILTPIYMTVISAYVFNREPGFHVYLLLAAIIPVFMWSFKQKGYLFFFIPIYILIYLFLEFLDSPFESLIIMSENYVRYFYSSNILGCFIGMGAAIGVYQWFINKKEAQLIEQAEELKTSQKHKDIVYSIIAHDLKGPIGSFVNLTKYFSENFDASDAERLLQIIERMRTTSGSVQALLENLLDWSKMQSGHLTQNYTTFNVKEIAEESLQLYNEAAKEKSLKIESSIDSTLKGHADRYMISTIFRNLISNAIKFTPEMGKILINAKLINDEIQVCVSDTGIGMTQVEMNNLFNTHKIDDNQMTEKNQGGGLGLLICKDFVENNQGRIWFESEKEKGSKFYFTINCAQ